MGLGEIEKSGLAEIIVFLVVVISTISINYNQVEEQKNHLEVERITGTVELSTEESMNALGLQEFRVGALATIDMNVQKVVAEDCKVCLTTPQGIEINGTANITNLKDKDSIGNTGSTGRVEGKLSIIHLSEYVKPNFVSKEWISIDWDAGDSSTQWEIYINHIPPKWNPSNRYSTSFVNVPEGMESRAGPLVLVSPIMNQVVTSKGCLPTTFSCDESSTNINLESVLDTKKTPKIIEHSSTWELQTINSTGGEDPIKNEKIRSLFNLSNEISSDKAYCPNTDQQIITSKSWEISETSNSFIAPMSIWMEVFSLDTNAFSPLNAKVWKEVDYSNSGCANLETKEGVLLLGIFVS